MTKDYSKNEILEALAKADSSAACFDDDLASRILNNPNCDRYLKGVIATGDELRNDPTPPLYFSLFRRFETDGDRTDFEISQHGYFSRRRKLLTYAILAWLYGKEEDIRSLEDIVWAILDEYTWALPAHLGGKGLVNLQDDGYTIDLFAAETGFALSETLILVGDRLSPIVQKRIRREVKERIIDRATASFGWQKNSNNWAAVCAGNTGMAAMYLLKEEENDRLADILAVCLASMKHYLSGFSEDGACLEGLGYWSYGFGFFLAFADMLKRRTAGAIDLFDDPKVHLAATFYQKCFFKGGRYVSFSDASNKAAFSLSTMNYLHSIYPDVILPSPEYCVRDYCRTGCFRFAFGIRQLAFAPVGTPKTSDPCGTYVFPYAQWYLASAENGVGIAAKAGNNDEPHNHNDVGAFSVYKNGKIIITDVGGGEYSKDYFSPATRYSIFCNSSMSHSVPIVEGKYQTEGADSVSKDFSVNENGLSADIAAAYRSENLVSLLRDVRFDRVNGDICVTDTVKFRAQPSAYIERFATPCVPEIGEGFVLLADGGEGMLLSYDSDRLTVSVSKVVDKNHVVEDRTTYLVDFTPKALNSEMQFAFRISAKK